MSNNIWNVTSNSNVKGLPIFFGNASGISVLDELSNLTLDKDELILADDEPIEDTFGDDAFGDFDAKNLPDFFTTKNNDHGDLLSSSKNKDPNLFHLPPGAVQSNFPPPPPPGLSIMQNNQNSSNHSTNANTASIPVPVPINSIWSSSVGSNESNRLYPAPVNNPISSAPLIASAQPNISTSNNNNAINSNSISQNNSNAMLPLPTGVPLVQINPHVQNQYSRQTSTSLQDQPAKRRDFPRGKYMNPSDIRFVVNKVMQPLESNDPFSDDFYFLQSNIKKNALATEAALKEQKPLPPMIYVPLPTWKETKERIKLQMEIVKQTLHDRSKKWEETEQVLGHLEKSNVSKPRSQLALPSFADLEFDLDNEDENIDLKNPFSSRLWTVRQAVQRGYEALYTVQELQHLLSSPMVQSNQISVIEIQKEIEIAVNLLSQSIGIRVIEPGSHMVGLLAQVGGHIGNENLPDFSLDGGHVGAILLTAKGKKLMSRSIRLLAPAHRWALVPVILSRILQASSTSSVHNSSNNNNTQNALLVADSSHTLVEQKLLRTIIEFLQYSFQFQIDEQQKAPPNTPARFTNILLMNLRLCLKSVMVTQMEKSKLRQALLSDRCRAEVMHLIVQIGDKLLAVVEMKLKEEWVQTREAFMSMLDN
eukprot:gene5711-7883_t